MNRSRSGFVYLMALLVVLVVSGIAVLLAAGGGRQLRAGNAAAGREAARAAALGVLRAVVNDLDTAMAAGAMPGLRSVVPAGEQVGGCTVVLLGSGGFGLLAQGGLLDLHHAPPALLAALPGLDEAVAAAIADWRDVDETPLDGGAERGDGAYTGAATPYAPRNAPFETLEELRLVRGITDAAWFGEDINRNRALDAGEDADGDGRLDPGLCDLLTLESREPALAPDGTARTTVQNQSALRRRLIEVLGAERGGALASEAQRRQPFANRLELVAALDLDEGEAAALWPCLIGPEGRVGLLDAASAGEEVLVAALGRDLAARILALRPAGDAALDPAWLAEALGRDLARSAGMLLTVGSWRFTADLLAVRDDGSGWARLLVDIDCSARTARVAGIRPAEPLGWPLPAATPQRLRALAPADVPAFLATGFPR